MNIIEDSRQKIGAHILKNMTWKADGDQVYRCKIPYGDYALPPAVSVDTKADLREMTTNLCGARKERERVEREEKLAKKLGGKLIYLIETDEVSTKADLIGRKIPLRSGQIIDGEQLMKAMDQHEAIFGSKFVFCPPEEAGKKVKELLQNGG